MKKNRKEPSVGRDNLQDKGRNNTNKKAISKNRINANEYEEDRSMNIRMKPQPFKSDAKNMFHEDNKDE
jgi:hypothetical protein